MTRNSISQGSLYYQLVITLPDITSNTIILYCRLEGNVIVMLIIVAVIVMVLIIATVVFIMLKVVVVITMTLIFATQQHQDWVAEWCKEFPLILRIKTTQLAGQVSNFTGCTKKLYGLMLFLNQNSNHAMIFKLKIKIPKFQLLILSLTSILHSSRVSN